MDADTDGTHYSLTMEDINHIISLTIDQARSDWHWGEGVDTGVLRVKIKREVLQQATLTNG